MPAFRPIHKGVLDVRLKALITGALLAVCLCLAACGGATRARDAAGVRAASEAAPTAHPQVVEPTAGVQAAVVAPADPVGDVHAQAPPLSQIRRELRLELVAVRVTSAGYINPLYYVTCCGRWERTDQGIDATMPVGAPILAPSAVKILGIEPNWYLGQPLVYFELLAGPDAGKIQYVAEEITSIAPVGTYLHQGQAIARFAASGTGIEYGWSTINGVTLAAATTGYGEGQITPAGRLMRAWLNGLGAKAGPDY